MFEIGDIVYLRNKHYNRAYKITDSRMGIILAKTIFPSIFEIYFPTVNNTLRLGLWEIETIEKWSTQKVSITL